MSASKVFRRLTVEAHFNVVTDGRVLVTWALDPTFTDRGPYTFTLERGYAANDDKFVQLARTVDQPWMYDNRPVLQTLGTQVYYRVSMTTGEGKTYISQAAPLQSYWERPDWLIAREIIRKENLLLRKRTGLKGWLLKRRVWGEPCPVCSSIAGHTKDPNCGTCYGTGFVGGYYAPFEYWVSADPTRRVTKISDEEGIIAETIETVRGLAYPQPDPSDVFIKFGTDQRYVIQEDITAVARHRGVDLVVSLRLMEQPRSSSVYLLPLDV